jgi:hypothetical protein
VAGGEAGWAAGGEHLGLVAGVLGHELGGEPARAVRAAEFRGELRRDARVSLHIIY